MCLIIIKPKGVKYNDKIKSYVIKSASVNNDGFGIAIHRSGVTVQSEKFSKVEELIKFLETNKIDKNHTMMIHLRLRTHGQISKKNTHPFRIPFYETSKEAFETLQNAEKMTSSNVVLMHNGILSGYNDPENIKSDTYLFTEYFLNKKLSKLYNNSNLNMMELLYKIKGNKQYNDPKVLKTLNSYDLFKSNRLAFLCGNNGLLLTGNWYKDAHGLLLSNNGLQGVKAYPLATG